MAAVEGNFKRKSTDYVWIAAFYAVFYVAGNWQDSARSSLTDRRALNKAMDVLGLENPIYVQAVFFFITAAGMSGVTALIFVLIKALEPSLPTKHLVAQMKTISGNLLFVLPLYQSVLNYLMTETSLSKVTLAHTSPAEIVLDLALWLLVFELSWYVQHRLMHDNYYLWKYGHEYHHQWKKPEHMIGVTNFAFDHIVEGWVTMSSSFAPLLFFTLNYYTTVIIGFLYMILAVLVHWDGFPIRYHLNHHYAVVKNYGSHIPLFDMFFNTYKGNFIEFASTRAAAAKAKKVASAAST